VLLILKLTIVPLFIGLITLVGRKWGSSIAGLMSAFPVVAGPIVIFIAIEQGPEFATLTATSAISATACLLTFWLAYSWACIRLSWPLAILSALVAWFFSALTLAMTTLNLGIALLIAIGALIITPFLLPRIKLTTPPNAKLHDLHWRMLVGGLLTISVTTLAVALGEVWSGILAVFPVIGSVLAIFTHSSLGATHVAQVSRGMVKGLYSFVAFFLSLTLLLQHTTVLIACLISITVATVTQVIALFIAKLITKKYSGQTSHN
jgi:uncharacterized membrane protein (GlpM family)